MDYIFTVLIVFIVLLLITQIILFELSRNRALKQNNLSWFLSLDKPFSYNRFGHIFFMCLICFVITGGVSLFSIEGILYFVLFLAIGIVSDMIVQYITLIYSKKRCKKEIQLSKELTHEINEVLNNRVEDHSYVISERQYDEKDILKQYVDANTHLAYLSIDGGKFARECNLFPEATFVVEPYGDIAKVKEDMADLPVQVTKLTPSRQMPFKDERIDVVMCQFANYEKDEILRVLKKDGYFIVNQNGTTNYKELLNLYVPFKIKGTWDAFSCVQSLEDAGMSIIDKYEEYGTIRFTNVNQISSYFAQVSPDFADIEKYKVFYTNALNEIKTHGFYELTTHRFLVVAKKV